MTQAWSVGEWLALIAGIVVQLGILLAAIGGFIVTIRGNKAAVERAVVREAKALMVETKVDEIHTASGASSVASTAVAAAVAPIVEKAPPLPGVKP